MTKPQGFDLLWEEKPCFVVAKPGGLLTQAPPGIDSLEIRIKQWLAERQSSSNRVYLGVPHRIDRPASGALVMASQLKATRRLCEQFEDRTVEKSYWALVEGQPSEPAGSWSDMIRKIPGEARAELVPLDHPQGRTAIMHYRVHRVLNAISWLEIRLETGRTHQIRVQLASRGLPILGDHQYGATRSFGPLTAEPRERWIALHARLIRFHHPATRERIEVEAPLPSCWREFLEESGG